MRKLGMSLARFESDSPQDALFDRIQTAIAVTPASSIDMRTRTFVAMAVAAGLTTAVVLIASHIVYHQYAPGLVTAASSVPYAILVLLLLVAQTLVATLLAAWRGRSGFGSEATTLYLTCGLVAPIYAALVMINPIHAHDPTPGGVAISALGLRCLALSAIVGVLVLASLLLALRRSVPVSSRVRGAAVGAAAGAWAGLSVFIFCPSDDPRHIFIGHVLPIVLFTVLGIATVPRVLRL